MSVDPVVALHSESLDLSARRASDTARGSEPRHSARCRSSTTACKNRAASAPVTARWSNVSDSGTTQWTAGPSPRAPHVLPSVRPPRSRPVAVQRRGRRAGRRRCPARISRNMIEPSGQASTSASSQGRPRMHLCRAIGHGTPPLAARPGQQRRVSSPRAQRRPAPWPRRSPRPPPPGPGTTDTSPDARCAATPPPWRRTRASAPSPDTAG